MKRFLLPLLAALALPTAVNSEISDKIHERCKDARDYMGCVEMMKEKRYRQKGKWEKTKREIEMRRIRDKQMRLENRMELDKINRQRGYGY